jgi:N-acetylneuraminic acid mutarotase
MIGFLVILTTFFVLDVLRRQNEPENQPSEIGISSGNEQLWSLKAPLPSPRAQLAVVPYQDKLLTFGGLSEAGTTGVVEQYDIPTDQWKTLAEKPVKVAGIQGVVIDDRVYIPGGKLIDGSTTDALEIYSITDNTWTQGANLPITVSDYGLAALDGKVYLMGGWDGEKTLNSVFEYDPEADLWVPGVPMLTARSQFGAVTINGKIFVFGGYDGKSALALTEVFAPGEDGSSGAWKSAAPMPHSSYGMGATSLLDIAYLVGGDDLSKKDFPILVFYTSSEEWQSIELPKDYHLGSTMGVTSQGQYLYMVGGIKDDTLLENLYSYKALITTSLPLIIK